MVIRGCFSRAAAAEFTAHIWQRLGYDEHDPSTWTEPLVHMPSRRRLDVHEFAPRAWEPASATSPGWHKDGDFFRHFLDSPEQGLLTLVLWSDVEHQGGATFVAADSVGPVARFL